MKVFMTLALIVASAVSVTGASAGAYQQATGSLVYEIRELDGEEGTGTGINNRGWVTGYAKTDAGTWHAMLWRHGKPVDLGTLGGPHSATIWPVKNELGLVVGISHTAETDRLGEEWSCGAFIPVSGKACRGFVWQNNKMTELKTFGGTHGFAAGVNNFGQVVGWAEIAQADPSCKGKQVLGFRAAVWDASTGNIRELPPLLGDSTSAATAINDRGQVVGISGDCNKAVGRSSAREVVLWENGRTVVIGGFGAGAWNTAMAINTFGQVVGFANRAGTVGDALNEEAFVWTRQGGIRALGTLSPGENSQAFGVNNLGQVVGISRAGGSTRPFLWQHGRMIELKGHGYSGTLLSANDINDFGVITGQAKNAEGKYVTFVATPVWR